MVHGGAPKLTAVKRWAARTGPSARPGWSAPRVDLKGEGSAPGDGREEIELVAVGQAAFEALVERATLAVQHQCVAQVRAAFRHLPERHLLSRRRVEQLREGA